MTNLYYRGYVIREEIRSICYTIFGCRPDRTEITSRGSALEAMRWVDRDVARKWADLFLRRDKARMAGGDASTPSQHVLL